MPSWKQTIIIRIIFHAFWYYSKAVDFAKTGAYVPPLTKEHRPAAYPKFMEKHDKPVGKSISVLGQLYDDVEKYKFDEDVEHEDEIQWALQFPFDDLIMNGHEKYLKQAKLDKTEYDNELQRMMRQYGIRSEAELVSGQILNFYAKQYKNETKLFDLRNEINQNYQKLRNKFVFINSIMNRLEKEHTI